jgi:hypothetical protein
VLEDGANVDVPSNESAPSFTSVVSSGCRWPSGTAGRAGDSRKTFGDFKPLPPDSSEELSMEPSSEAAPPLVASTTSNLRRLVVLMTTVGSVVGLNAEEPAYATAVVAVGGPGGDSWRSSAERFAASPNWGAIIPWFMCVTAVQGCCRMAMIVAVGGANSDRAKADIA